ncbi:MAG: glutathione S-transferase, partial [Candidatus Binatota bacterium]|nr:glutathione S-transferase [Candidatus Binatota bacterium]
DLSKGEHKRPDYLKIHPHGAVPALVDGDVTMFESAAICAYLADKYPEKRLAPPAGSSARGPYYQWIVYSMATLEPPVLQVFLNTMMLSEDKRSPAAADEGRNKFGEVREVLERALDGKRYLVGDGLTAADVMVGSILDWSRAMKLLDGSPNLEAYVKRLAERPAFQKARAD